MSCNCALRPSRSRIELQEGISDSPTWSRGIFSRSTKSTENPARETIVATVEPAGPPPITIQSKSDGDSTFSGMLIYGPFNKL